MDRLVARALFATLFLLVASACGRGTDSEESLITDQEIGELQHQALTSTPATTQAPAGASHVRLAWGYLAGKKAAPDWIDWTGNLRIDAGKATLEHLIFFEKNDQLTPSDDPSTVSWKSHTRPHFDGMVIHVEPSAAQGKVTITTPQFTTELDAAKLAQGVEQRFTTDLEGHEVSISSIPAAGCGGFVLGYERPSKEGWLAFGGRITDATGVFTDRLRFRADGQDLEARVLNANKEVVATGKGQLSPSSDGGTFELALSRPDGSSYGSFKGLFHAPSYSVRGSFQGTWACGK